MELSELVTYARETYQIEEQHKWAEFPGFSVLCHPQTGKWAALLMRQWDSDSGTVIEYCDLKCGRQTLSELNKPYLSAPLRMQGPKWISVAFGRETEEEVVFRLFDRAVASGNQRGYTIVLDSPGTAEAPAETIYHATPLPFERSSYRPPKEALPEKLRELRHMYSYGMESTAERAAGFYRQAKFMEDFEDDAPWQDDFVCYFPTYQDLTTKQLRGYFSWRARVRRGEYQHISASAAYLYIYELLNGIGAVSVEDSLEKLKAFMDGYTEEVSGDRRMQQNLKRWMLELAVISGLPPEQARHYADPEMLERDHALTVLRSPSDYPDEEVFLSLCCLGGKKLAQSPVLTNDAAHGVHLFAEAWRIAAPYRIGRGKDQFTRCFGKRIRRQWSPLANAIYCRQKRPEDCEYVLDECRSYHCTDGFWQSDTFEKSGFDKGRLQGFLREADLLLRRYLKTGKYLKENLDDNWAAPLIEQVIAADRQAAAEADRMKVTIDLSALDRIRLDAITTRDSLLTEEEKMEEPEKPAAPSEAIIMAEYVSDIPLDEVQFRILHALLSGKSADTILRENHLMPSIAADAINEVLFDEIGDVAVLCEDDELSIVEDYEEELRQLLGGIQA